MKFINFIPILLFLFINQTLAGGKRCELEIHNETPQDFELTTNTSYSTTEWNFPEIIPQNTIGIAYMAPNDQETTTAFATYSLKGITTRRIHFRLDTKRYNNAAHDFFIDFYFPFRQVEYNYNDHVFYYPNDSETRSCRFIFKIKQTSLLKYEASTEFTYY